MSPYENGELQYRLSGFNGWNQENFLVFAVGLEIAYIGGVRDGMEQLNWAYGFLAAHNKFKAWKQEQEEKHGRPNSSNNNTL